MGDIYENAYATLFVERVAHCEGGLFQTDEDKGSIKHLIREIVHRDLLTNDPLWILASTRHSSLALPKLARTGRSILLSRQISLTSPESGMDYAERNTLPPQDLFL